MTKGAVWRARRLWRWSQWGGKTGDRQSGGLLCHHHHHHHHHHLPHCSRRQVDIGQEPDDNSEQRLLMGLALMVTLVAFSLILGLIYFWWTSSASSSLLGSPSWSLVGFYIILVNFIIIVLGLSLWSLIICLFLVGQTKMAKFLTNAAHVQSFLWSLILRLLRSNQP